MKVRNYKGVATLDLALDESLTVLAGINGVGKTSILEALLGAVTKVWSRLAPTGQEAWFRPSGDLVRYGVREGKITLEVVFGNDVQTTYNVSINPRLLDEEDFYTSEVLSTLSKTISPMPLVVYYDQNRIGGLRSERYRSSSATNRNAALDTTPDTLSDFKNWFFEKETDEAREAVERGDLEYADPEVTAVQEVLKNIAGDSTVLRSRKPDGSMDRMLFLRKEGGLDIPFEALSGGEQAYFLLAVDLARRLLLEFPGNTLAQVPGLVCIDEIDLHLHPAWQRKILTSLMALFPRCQFVVSTHSPQVIGSVAARHVRLLSSDGKGRVDATEPIASKGRDSDYVLEGIMDTPEQDPEVDDLFAQFHRLVDAGELEKADAVLDALDELVEGKSSRVAVRRAKTGRLRRASE
ncbi:MAG: AAA family ATPase [Chloroflexi bacterium]|nr:AAA family ATPase [Chloroflexota bacterium]